MQDFIEVNGRVLDFEVYQETLHYLKEDILEDVQDVLKKQAFQLQTSVNKTYADCMFSFYNHKLDVEITLTVRKKKVEKWV